MADHDITLYWRPACGFCSSLRRQLDGTDLIVREVNIWDEPAAAATVRAYANGNETVPTVVIGEPGSDTAVGLVNPTARQVLAALDAHRR
ncbi:MAG: glutaredoxin domain-containing protein [Microthrixaceae bacterium]